MLTVSGLFYFIEAVIGQTVLKPAGFFFGSFFFHAGVNKPLLEIAVPFINLFGNRTAGICQIQMIIAYRNKAALFQK